MGDVVDVKPVSLVDNQEFIADCCRFAEGLLDEKAVRKKYRLADDVWEKFGNDDTLVRAIEAEKIRRIRDGSSKREKAQALVTKAPDILDGIMNDPSASPRHRIDSAKALDDFAANGPGASAPASDRFVITINLGSDTLRFDKSIAPDANDIDPYNPDTTPQGLLAVVAAKKKDDGGGEPL
jgi:hypothetical protein